MLLLYIKVCFNLLQKLLTFIICIGKPSPTQGKRLVENIIEGSKKNFGKLSNRRSSKISVSKFNQQEQEVPLENSNSNLLQFCHFYCEKKPFQKTSKDLNKLSLRSPRLLKRKRKVRWCWDQFRFCSNLYNDSIIQHVLEGMNKPALMKKISVNDGDGMMYNPHKKLKNQ